MTWCMAVVSTSCGALRCKPPEGAGAGETVTVIFRPEDVHVLGNGSGGGRSSDENILTGEVAEVMFVGEALECQVVVGDTRMRLKLHPATKVAPGQKIDLAIPVDRCRVLAE